MIAIRRKLTHPLRRWRTRGFGIHSPFAFALMTKVIGETDPYYCYDTLHSFSGERFAELTLIVRLICRFRPAEVAVNNLTEPLRTAICSADSRCRIAPITPTSGFCIIDAAKPVSALPETDNAVIVVRNITCSHRRLWKQLSASIEHGMTFNDGRIGIICRDTRLPRLAFRFALK